MVRFLVGALTVVLSAGLAAAQDKKTTWEREFNGVNLTFEFGKDTLKVTALQGENGTVFICKSNIDKDGLVTAVVTDVASGEHPRLQQGVYSRSSRGDVLVSRVGLHRAGDLLDALHPLLSGERDRVEFFQQALDEMLR